MIEPNEICCRPCQGFAAIVRMPSHGLRRGLIAIDTPWLEATAFHPGRDNID